MGVYLNPGNDRFQRVCNSEIYVDKTGLIALTNRVIDTGLNCVCISRPGCFGKSITASMLAAYYGKNCDSTELFSPYQIAQCESYETYLNRYNVIFLNIQKIFARVDTVEEMLQYIQKEILAELREVCCDRIPEEETILSAALEKLYSKSKEKFVFIIDGWDYVFGIEKENTQAQKKYVDFLGDLLKDQMYVSLACMTGILPVKKYKIQSALNMFLDYSMVHPAEYAEYTGFTEEEVSGLCEKYHADFETMKSWYGGYTFPKTSYIYNPKSVVTALCLGVFESCWTRTKTDEALGKYIDMNFDGLKDVVLRMMNGEGVSINSEKIQNDVTALDSRDDVLVLLVHLGYLAFDRRTSIVFIPNAEMLVEFCNLLGG